MNTDKAWKKFQPLLNEQSRSHKYVSLANFQDFEQNNNA